MVVEARSLLPMDLLALIAHRTMGHENGAWPRERLGSRETPALSVLRDQLQAFGRERDTWVSRRKQKLVALVSTRPRGARQAREVDYLVDNGAGTAEVAILLTQAVTAAGEDQAEKLFLRLEAGSAHLAAAREAGFVPYQEELLLVHRGDMPGEPAPCRPLTPADSYPLFRLYTAGTPEAVRRHEAATYGEWQAGMERRWLRGGVQLAMERECAIESVVRASRLPQGDLFELTLGPDAKVEAVALILAAERELSGTGSGLRYTLLPQTSEGIARQLSDAGFEVAGPFVSLVHRTTRPLALPKAVPAAVENAVGV